MTPTALLLQSKKTVFSIEDLAKILNTSNLFSVRQWAARMKKSGTLIHLFYGIRGLPNYEPLELAMKIKTSSYISLETVLWKEGAIFQPYENTITCVSNNTITKKAENYTFTYRKIQNVVLYDTTGIVQKKTYMIASLERAITDLMYLTRKKIHIDDTSRVNIYKLREIAEIYYDTRLSLLIEQLINDIR